VVAQAAAAGGPGLGLRAEGCRVRRAGGLHRRAALEGFRDPGAASLGELGLVLLEARHPLRTLARVRAEARDVCAARALPARTLAPALGLSLGRSACQHEACEGERQRCSSTGIRHDETS
jgi:hypothetical protein